MTGGLLKTVTPLAVGSCATPLGTHASVHGAWLLGIRCLKCKRINGYVFAFLRIAWMI
jgi:hypothetical protein